MMTITKLLKKYPLVSDQVDAEQLQVILRELDTVIKKKLAGQLWNLVVISAQPVCLYADF